MMTRDGRQIRDKVSGLAIRLGICTAECFCRCSQWSKRIDLTALEMGRKKHKSSIGLPRITHDYAEFSNATIHKSPTVGYF